MSNDVNPILLTPVLRTELAIDMGLQSWTRLSN